jgi:hypothetical protein
LRPLPACPRSAIAVDDYTTVKLTGALGTFGQSGVVHATELATAGARIDELWGGRAVIRQHAAELGGEHRRETNDWWSRIFEALSSA